VADGDGDGSADADAAGSADGPPEPPSSTVDGGTAAAAGIAVEALGDSSDVPQATTTRANVSSVQPSLPSR
jgi:hypothetical protein